MKNNLKPKNLDLKEKMKKLNIVLFALTFLFITPFILSSANYGDGTYGAGIYGQVSCGDAVCELSESCSTCSADCGTCPSGGRAIDKGYIEEIKSWIEITPELGAVISNFDEDFGISEIRLKVSGETRNARITFRKYHSKPEEIFVEAPGIVYKYLRIETQNLETLEEATLKIQVMRTWASENNVDNSDISLYRFDEDLGKWNKLDTNLSSEDEIDYFYDIVLSSFSFFAISGEVITPLVPGEEIPEEIETVGLSNSKKLGLILIILASIILISLLLIIIFIRIIDKRYADKITKEEEGKYLSGYISEYNRRMKKWYEIKDRNSRNRERR